MSCGSDWLENAMGLRISGHFSWYTSNKMTECCTSNKSSPKAFGRSVLVER